MNDPFEERAWFAFAVTAPGAGPHGPMTSYVPAATEQAARAKMRDTVHSKLVGLVDTWPLIGTRFCSREALTKSLLRERPGQVRTEGHGPGKTKE